MKIQRIHQHKSGARLKPRISTQESDKNSGNEAQQEQLSDSAGYTSRGSVADQELAKDMVLCAVNESAIYDSAVKNFIPNLARKMAKGVYDPQKAVKLWGYWADQAADFLVKDRRGAYYGATKPNPATRRLMAEIAAEYYDEDVKEMAAEMGVAKEAGKPWTHVSGAKLKPHKSAFMQPDVYEDDYYSVEADHGSTYIVPKDVAGEVETWGELQDYVEGKIDRPNEPAELEHGWVGRMSAPGYLDATDWCAGATEQEVIEQLENYYGLDLDGDEGEGEEHGI